MTKRSKDYTIEKRDITRYITLHGKPPICSCGCGREIKEKDEVHATSKGHLHLIECWTKLQH